MAEIWKQIKVLPARYAPGKLLGQFYMDIIYIFQLQHLIYHMFLAETAVQNPAKPCKTILQSSLYITFERMVSLHVRNMPNHTGYTPVIITVFIQNRSINRYIMKKHKRKFPARLFTAMKRELREHRSSFIAYNIFRALVIVIMIFTIFNRNFESSFLCLLTLILLTVPSLMQVALKIELPTVLEITLLAFIFAAEILGELCNFYTIFPYWDTVLHTLNGFLMAAIGLSLVQLLNSSDRILFQLSPVFTSIVSFCFSMTIGVLWEFFEFSMDRFFELDMQKDTVVHKISSVLLNPAGENVPIVIKNIRDVTVSGTDLGLGGYLDIGLIDTMADLFVNFIGAMVFAILGYFYVKNREQNSVVGKLIPRKKDNDKDYLAAQDR